MLLGYSPNFPFIKLEKKELWKLVIPEVVPISVKANEEEREVVEHRNMVYHGAWKLGVAYKSEDEYVPAVEDIIKSNQL